jgi:beta-phosphoglucomutase family hydrolase
MLGSKAVIWDMDGVIINTAPYHLKAWQVTLQKRGVNFSEYNFKQTFGQRNDAIIKGTLGEGIAPHEIESISCEKELNFRGMIGDRIQSLPGVIELITSLNKSGFPMALASSAPIENIELVISSLGINDYFQSIICDNDVAEGKPSPQVFLLAAERLGVEPGDCVVIEDAVTGVAAAKRAGMFCLAVANTHSRHNLLEADLVVETLEVVSVNDIEMLFSP